MQHTDLKALSKTHYSEANEKWLDYLQKKKENVNIINFPKGFE